MNVVTIPKGLGPRYHYYRSEVCINNEKGKNIWTNFDEIVKQLRCNKQHLVDKINKYLCQSMEITKSGLLIKHLSRKDIENTLEQYIHKYIICKKCGLPELTNGMCRICEK